MREEKGYCFYRIDDLPAKTRGLGESYAPSPLAAAPPAQLARGLGALTLFLLGLLALAYVLDFVKEALGRWP